MGDIWKWQQPERIKSHLTLKWANLWLLHRDCVKQMSRYIQKWNSQNKQSLASCPHFMGKGSLISFVNSAFCFDATACKLLLPLHCECRQRVSVLYLILAVLDFLSTVYFWNGALLLWRKYIFSVCSLCFSTEFPVHDEICNIPRYNVL